MTSKFDAILSIQFAAEKISQAANCAYWLKSYSHEGADYQLNTIRDEYAKLVKAMDALNAAPEEPAPAPVEEDEVLF